MDDAKGRSRAGGSAPPSRRLVAIMFTDLVGYSAMAHRDEGLAIELLELHRAWVREILPLHGGIEIETIGDGFLIEFAGALSAVECGVAIQRRFAEYNAAAPAERRMELRVGVHLGDVEHRGDKVFGDGVNIASRIHGMAKPGGICVSEDVHHAVRNRPAFQFTSLGTPPLKNITTPLELFELAPSLSLAPPAEVAVVKVPPAASAPVARPRRWLPLAVAGGVGAVALAFALGWFARRAPAVDTPAIAVLPFENLSAEADSAFFTDGLHDSVIGHLSRVGGLKVISRTSVMGYRGQRPNLRQVASDLGVNSVVEGSVQRAGSKLRVVAQLIDTKTDTHLWSSEYDRDMADVFAVQADIAQQVARAVKVKLSPQEQASIKSVPTQNAAAYELYLRALVFQRRPTLSPKETQEAIAWLDQAVQLDPDFAQAYAMLAHLHDYLSWFGFDGSAERRRLVGTNADKALALAPHLAESHVAKALHLYHGSRNYDAAIRELETARAQAPGSADVAFWLAPIYRRQGRWDEALANFQRAEALDPLSANILFEHASTLQSMRRYAESATVWERLVRIAPDDPTFPVLAAYDRFLRDGDLAALEQAVARAPVAANTDGTVCYFRHLAAMHRQRYDAAAAAGSECPPPFLSSSGGEQMPREFLAAMGQWLGSGRRQAPAAVGVRKQFEGMLAANADLPVTRMNLAFVLLMLGERERALEHVGRALADLPVSRDAYLGTQLLLVAAQVRANAGDVEGALALLEQAVKLPAGGHVVELRLDPLLEPVRKDPRFEQLLARHFRT